MLKSLPQQFGDQIAMKRKHLHLSQRQLGELIGTSQATIARIEAGQANPTLKLLQRIVNALELTAHITAAPQVDPKQNVTWMD